MSLFSRIFRRSDTSSSAPATGPAATADAESEQQRQEELVRALESARDVVKAYGTFMQSEDFPGAGSVADVKKLPYPKEMLKAALKICIRVTDKEEHSKALRDVYIRLGDFQEGVGDRNLGFVPVDIPDVTEVERMTDEEKERLIGIATEWTARMKEATVFLHAAEEEKRILAREMAEF